MFKDRLKTLGVNSSYAKGPISIGLYTTSLGGAILSPTILFATILLVSIERLDPRYLGGLLVDVIGIVLRLIEILLS